MKVRVQKMSEEGILADFPIKGKTHGWFFRMEEVSNGAWIVEGSDRWGRRVSRGGGDPDEMLAACEEDVARIEQGPGEPKPKA